MPGAAISVESVLKVLAQQPGQAVLLLGVASRTMLAEGEATLAAGVGALDIPQGVTVIRTDPRTASSLLRGGLTEPEAVLGRRLMADDDLRLEGYLQEDWQIMPGEVLVDEPVVTGPTQAELNAEAALWDAATQADTVEAYRRYVARYPSGRFVADAEAQIAAILSEPNRTVRLIEEDLNLTRADRRDIQSDLTLLNFNTRGVDGIFGGGTRGAITNWQQVNGFPQTSFLTRDQFSLLDAQAARRQAEIDTEAARELAAEQERDRSYWV